MSWNPFAPKYADGTASSYTSNSTRSSHTSGSIPSSTRGGRSSQRQIEAKQRLDAATDAENQAVDAWRRLPRKDRSLNTPEARAVGERMLHTSNARKQAERAEQDARLGR